MIPPLDKIIDDIVTHLPRYQQSIKCFKDDNYQVIGYARKSRGEKDDATRIRLLKQMCFNLREVLGGQSFRITLL